MEQFTGTLKDIPKRLTTLEALSSTTRDEDIIEEITNRQKRSCNLILLNLNETDFSSDMNSVRSLLQTVSSEDIYGDFKIKRLGKKDNRTTPRPLCVSFKSPSVPLSILKNKRKCSGPIKIFLDQTIKQRTHLNNLRSELRELNDDNKTIKYFNGIPKIVSMRKESKNDHVRS